MIHTRLQILFYIIDSDQTIVLVQVQCPSSENVTD
jgi:hypothetical protein